MSNLVNLVKSLLGSMFDIRSFEAKNRVFEFDHLLMNTYKFFQCSKNDVRVHSIFDKWCSTNSKISILTLPPPCPFFRKMVRITICCCCLLNPEKDVMMYGFSAAIFLIRRSFESLHDIKIHLLILYLPPFKTKLHQIFIN